MLGLFTATSRGQELAAGRDEVGGSPLGIGVRVGSGGVEKPSVDALCYGVFGHLGLSAHLFGEIALDRCPQSTEDAAGMREQGTQISAALGLRFWRAARVSPFMQLGVGGEVASVQRPGQPDDDGIFPLAFVGAGLDVHLSGHLALGVNLRWQLQASFADSAAEPDVASDRTAQLFLRWDL